MKNSIEEHIKRAGVLLRNILTVAVTQINPDPRISAIASRASEAILELKQALLPQEKEAEPEKIEKLSEEIEAIKMLRDVVDRLDGYLRAKEAKQ